MTNTELWVIFYSCAIAFFALGAFIMYRANKKIDRDRFQKHIDYNYRESRYINPRGGKKQ